MKDILRNKLRLKMQSVLFLASQDFYLKNFFMENEFIVTDSIWN